MKLLTEQELADFLQVKPKTLRNWRTMRKGPLWLKVGGSVRYDLADVYEWIDRKKKKPGRN